MNTSSTIVTIMSIQTPRQKERIDCLLLCQFFPSWQYQQWSTSSGSEKTIASFCQQPRLLYCDKSSWTTFLPPPKSFHKSLSPSSHYSCRSSNLYGIALTPYSKGIMQCLSTSSLLLEIIHICCSHRAPHNLQSSNSSNICPGIIFNEKG